MSLKKSSESACKETDPARGATINYAWGMGAVLVAATGNDALATPSYPAGDANIYTTYTGRGGVPIGSFIRRLLYAFQLGSLKILLSDDIRGNAKILYRRTVVDRATTAMPFLDFDNDPYLIVNDAGQLKWILDAYTESDAYPYSQRTGDGTTYMRNSVKVVIDAYDGTLVAYVSAPEQSNLDVTIGKTGFNPYRTSQFTNLDAWTKAGMSETAAKNYLGAIKDSLESPNMILDMRIPKTQQYQQVVLDQALAQFLAGEINRDEAMKQIFDGWEQITNQEGRDKQLAAYKSTLGVQR